MNLKGYLDDGYTDMLTGGQKDTILQIEISLFFGFVAFITFCIFRTRWHIYAGRKKQAVSNVTGLPDLPKSMFGWIPVVWNISEHQVLAAAGLDAYIFLAFFKFAILYLGIIGFFALVVVKPVHDAFEDDRRGNSTSLGLTSSFLRSRFPRTATDMQPKGDHEDSYYEADYLWMYLILAYIFTGILLYLLNERTKKIVKTRQRYLGNQTTLTDRTICLSGIPPNYQTERKIKEFIEKLKIGKVADVFLCRNWKELDDLMEERKTVLRKLEHALVEQKVTLQEERSLESSSDTTAPNDTDSDSETSALLHPAALTRQRRSPVSPRRGARSTSHGPTERIWGGFLNLQFDKVDAVAYYDDQLNSLDDRISRLRHEADFKPTSVAFVTMENVAACQMAVQAVLHPSPLEFIATPSPAPVDIDWKNTYMSEREKTIRFWSFTVFILVLTLFWSVLLVPLATVIDMKRIKVIWPQAYDFLNSHRLGRSLVQTQLPTLVISGLNVAVPYLYSWISYHQGFISFGDVELTIITRNFFFTFFNFFLVFTALGTASLSWGSFGEEPLRDTADKLARSIQNIGPFYVNYIILQAFGLFPFRLLEFGCAILYPFSKVSAKTLRDREELQEPSNFSFGFYLPQTILIFLMCIMYSVLRTSWQVILPGIAYFVIGFFVYKYQLLYAMTHTQHSTGKAWLIIVNRVIVGLVIFQVSVAGQLILKSAVKRSVLIIPLIIFTLWFSFVFFNRRYTRLMTYIALKSIHEDKDNENGESNWVPQVYPRQTGETMVMDVSGGTESSLGYINPNLVISPEQPWIEGQKPKMSRSNSYVMDNGLSEGAV